MNAKTVFAAVAFSGSMAGAFVVGSAAPAASAQSVACASGYHADRQGNCQPNNPQPNLQPCPAGYLATPFPSWGNSYKCVPIPAGYWIANCWAPRTRQPHSTLRHSRAILATVCNLYSITKGQQAIRDLAGAMRDNAGNMPPLPGADLNVLTVSFYRIRTTNWFYLDGLSRNAIVIRQS
jgi:hypothetical protein